MCYLFWDNSWSPELHKKKIFRFEMKSDCHLFLAVVAASSNKKGLLDQPQAHQEAFESSKKEGRPTHTIVLGWPLTSLCAVMNAPDKACTNSFWWNHCWTWYSKGRVIDSQHGNNVASGGQFACGHRILKEISRDRRRRLIFIPTFACLILKFRK